jgi:hypothetical protein
VESILPPVHFSSCHISAPIPFRKEILEGPDQHWTASSEDLTGENPLLFFDDNFFGILWANFFILLLYYLISKCYKNK